MPVPKLAVTIEPVGDRVGVMPAEREQTTALGGGPAALGAAGGGMSGESFALDHLVFGGGGPAHRQDDGWLYGLPVVLHARQP